MKLVIQKFSPTLYYVMSEVLTFTPAFFPEHSQSTGMCQKKLKAKK